MSEWLFGRRFTLWDVAAIALTVGACRETGLWVLAMVPVWVAVGMTGEAHALRAQATRDKA